MGVLAGRAEDEVQRAFAAVARARDEGLQFHPRGPGPGRGAGRGRGGPPGAGRAPGGGLRGIPQAPHGHAIDAQLHGYGANLDSVEFPDPRRLIEGSCFSVEPGVYLPGFGVRSEVDVLIRGGAAVVTGGRPQTELLTL